MRKHKLSNQEVAQILDDFLMVKAATGRGMTSHQECPLRMKQLEKIRLRCAGLGDEFPPDHRSEFCNEQGRRVIRDYIDQLRA